MSAGVAARRAAPRTAPTVLLAIAAVAAAFAVAFGVAKLTQGENEAEAVRGATPFERSSDAPRLPAAPPAAPLPP
ncbi:MAG: hypothetical protein ACRDL4_14750, partial [Thermoleophilaceae bacterium]